MATEPPYKLTELMAICAAREIRDGEIAFIGTGLPMLGGMLAKATHAPHALLIFESGVVDADPKRTPLSIGDACLVPGAAMLGGLVEVFGLILQPGYVDVGFIGGAQIDARGNLNTTVIGPYAAPKVRLPGSGGANDIGSLAKRTIVMMKQDARKFVTKVDYVTTPGYLDGPGGREKAGLPRGTGPWRVVTSRALFGFDEETKRLKLMAILKDLTASEVLQGMEIKPLVAERIEELRPPTDEELRVLRDQIDPSGIVIRGEKIQVER